MHDVLAGRIEQGVAPGIVTAVSRHGEVHVDVIGRQDIAGSLPMRHPRPSASGWHPHVGPACRPHEGAHLGRCFGGGTEVRPIDMLEQPTG
jgi:hypothetical protein